MTRLDSPGVEYDNLTYSWKSYWTGIEGPWTVDTAVTPFRSEQGYSVACNYFSGVYSRFCGARC
jgi:hypothetical protein